VLTRTTSPQLPVAQTVPSSAYASLINSPFGTFTVDFSAPLSGSSTHTAAWFQPTANRPVGVPSSWPTPAGVGSSTVVLTAPVAGSTRTRCRSPASHSQWLVAATAVGSTLVGSGARVGSADGDPTRHSCPGWATHSAPCR
jgi:hypothetical protein